VARTPFTFWNQQSACWVCGPLVLSIVRGRCTACGTRMDAAVRGDEAVDAVADALTDRGQVRAADTPHDAHTPGRGSDQRGIGLQRRRLVSLHVDMIGRQAIRVQDDVCIDIQPGGSWHAKPLVAGQDRKPPLPETPLHLGVELLGGEAGLFQVRGYRFNDHPNALQSPQRRAR
jgi:hypothetical protein